MGSSVLVVDDVADNRDLVRTVLNHHGYDVREVDSGAAALQVLRTGAVDLVLTDVWMPGMDGFALARAIQDDPQCAGVPVIFYTAHYLAARVLADAEAAGIHRVVTKTGDLVELLDAVTDALGTKQR